ncbi:MAG: flagellar basal body-associated FliL family protein [Burkholderiaceae bacterium]
MADSKPAEEAPKKKSKLPIIIIAVVLLLGGGGGAGWFFLLKNKGDDAHAEEKAADDHAAEEKHAKRKPSRKKKSSDPATPRQFVTLEPFVVNLNDTKQDRFAQVGVVFEVEDAKVEGELNALTPAIRDAMLMLISSKTARELLTVAGKKKLGEQMTLAANAILDGDPPPLIIVPPAPEAAGAGAGDPNNRFAPPDAHGGAPNAAHGQPAPGQPPNPYAQHANPYGQPAAYGNPYGAPPAFDAYGRPIQPQWGAPRYDYPERVEATHFSSFIIQ